MTDSKSSRILRASLFTLVPAAYVSMFFWQSGSAYGKFGHGMPVACTVLMATVLLVSGWSWNTHRRMAQLGLLACFLWLATFLLPVL